MGVKVQGVAEFLARTAAKIYVNRTEADGLVRVTGAAESDLVRVDAGHTLDLDGVRIEFLHTPGHTPGSQCFLVNGEALVSGDTLFIEGCGRVDLPGGDRPRCTGRSPSGWPTCPDHGPVPGHNYGPVPSRTLGEERKRNFYLLVPTLDAWLRLMRRGR